MSLDDEDYGSLDSASNSRNPENPSTSLDTNNANRYGSFSVKISIECADGEVLTVPQNLLLQSTLLKSVLEVDSSTREIQLAEIESSEMKSIVEYLDYHQDRPAPKPFPRPLPSQSLRGYADDWDVNFVDSFEQDEVFRLVIASNYLDIPPLTDLLSAKIATYVIGKTGPAIRATLGIPDPSPSELAELQVLFPGIGD